MQIILPSRLTAKACPVPTQTLVAVVVTHNRLDKLKVTLNRLLETPTPHLPIILVFNNASTDGTNVWLDGLNDPRVQIIHNDRNIGGAGGFEQAMRFAMTEFDPDWLLLMDDDGRPALGTISAFHSDDWSAYDSLASAVYTPEGSICDINRPSRNPFWNTGAFLRTLLGAGREGFHLQPADYLRGETTDIDGASFVGLFVSRRAVERVGYPAGDLFVYGEDVLFTLSIRKAGGRIAFAPQLHFEHDYESIPKGEKRFRPLWKSYYYHRNLLIAYRRAAGLFFWPSLFVILPKWLINARHYQGQKRPYLRLCWLAIRDGLRQHISRHHDRIIALSESDLSD